MRTDSQSLWESLGVPGRAAERGEALTKRCDHETLWPRVFFGLSARRSVRGSTDLRGRAMPPEAPRGEQKPGRLDPSRIGAVRPQAPWPAPASTAAGAQGEWGMLHTADADADAEDDVRVGRTNRSVSGPRLRPQQRALAWG